MSYTPSTLPFQREAIEACVSRLKAGERSALLVMPPGTGRRFTASRIVVGLLNAGVIRRALILVQRKILGEQWIRLFGHETEVSWADLNRGYQRSTVEVTTMAAASRGSNPDPGWMDDFDLVVLDEGHLKSWVKSRYAYVDCVLEDSLGYPPLLPLKDLFKGKVLALTDMVDMQTPRLVSVPFPTFVYTFGQAVRDGFLLPFDVEKRPWQPPPIDSLDQFSADPLSPKSEAGTRLQAFVHNAVESLPGTLQRDAQGFPFKTVVVAPDQLCVQHLVAGLGAAFGNAEVVQGITNQEYDVSERIMCFLHQDFPRVAVTVERYEELAAPDVRNVVVLKPLRGRRLLRLISVGARLSNEKARFRVIDFVDALGPDAMEMLDLSQEEQ